MAIVEADPTPDLPDDSPARELFWGRDFKDAGAHIGGVLITLGARTYGDLSSLTRERLEEVGLDEGQIRSISAQLGRRGLALTQLTVED